VLMVQQFGVLNIIGITLQQTADLYFIAV